MSSPEHVLVIGATGQSGIDFCNMALKKGYKLTLYLRNPAKVPDEIKNHADVSIIQGGFDNVDKIQEAASCGATIFVSFAGPVANSKGTPVTNFMQTIFPMLIANGFKRSLTLGTCSWPAPQDKGALKWKLSVVFVKIIGGSAYEEFNKLGAFVNSQDVAQIKWTHFRVPFLTNGEEKPVTATFTGSGVDGMMLSRKSIARWVLDEMKQDSEWVGSTRFVQLK